MKLVLILVVFGYFQFVAFYFTPEWFYSFSFLGKGTVNITQSSIFLRVFSLSSEPVSFGNMLLPAIGFSLARLTKTVGNEVITKRFSVSILLIAFLTFSSVVFAYILAFSTLFIFCSNRVSRLYKVLFIFVVPIFIMAVSQIDVVKDRYNSVVNVFFLSEGITQVDNLSTFAIYSNIFVAKKSLDNDFVFGGGLFSHQKNYDLYIYDIFPPAYVRMELNKVDASSLYIRLLSETGILGFSLVILFFVSFIFRGYLNNYLISNIFLFSVVLLGIRSGTYNYSLVWFYLFAAIYIRRCKL
ncbi:hypothetical protein [Vibrio fluvialis]|uniref:hypothetical protein n=1 Tax=Vibrio fluvialis TaxID=676 RepID=UPI002739C68E|nr:hypothetical protein [Vibrio fluvialis]